MTNHTNTDDNTDINYNDPGLLLVGLILFLSFCSLAYGLYTICLKNTDIKSCLYKKKYIERQIESENESESESESEIEDLYYYSQNEIRRQRRNNRMINTVGIESESESESEVIKDEIEIKKIPTFANVNKYSMYCSICQESVLNSVKIDCGHSYCKECILEYTKLGRECPNCRKEIKGIYEIEVLVFN